MDLLGAFADAATSLLGGLLFPPPVGDATLPAPRQIPVPSPTGGGGSGQQPPPIAGGKCQKSYICLVKRGVQTLAQIPFEGPLQGFYQRLESNGSSICQGVVGRNGRETGGCGAVSPNPSLEVLGFPRYRITYPNGFIDDKSDLDYLIVTADGSPDDCDGDFPLAPEVPTALVPVKLPILPRLPPIIPPKPFPVPFPVPIPAPNPDWLPRPDPTGGTIAGPCEPNNATNCCNLTNNYTLKVDNKIKLEINLDLATGTGECDIPNYTPQIKQLLSLAMATYRDVQILGNRIRRVEIAAEETFKRICLYDGGMSILALGRIGGASQSNTIALDRSDPDYVPVSLRLDLDYKQTYYGRRARKGVPHLVSPETLGYYAIQHLSIGWSPTQEIRTFQTSVELTESAIAVSVWLEPPFEGFVRGIYFQAPMIQKFIPE